MDNEASQDCDTFGLVSPYKNTQNEPTQAILYYECTCMHMYTYMWPHATRMYMLK